MASATVMNSPLHTISTPPGCIAVVEEPMEMTEKEQDGVISPVSDTAGLSERPETETRTLSPATSQVSRSLEERGGPLMQSTPFMDMSQRRLPTPPPPDSSGYASSQTPPVRIVNLPHTLTSPTHTLPRSEAGLSSVAGGEANGAPAHERDKWQFPIMDQSLPRQTSLQNNSGYESDNMSEPSPYAVVKNLLADAGLNLGDDPEEICDSRRYRDPGYEEIELRHHLSLPSTRPHSRLDKYVLPRHMIGPPTTEQPCSIKSALRTTAGLSHTVREQLKKADELLNKQRLTEAVSCLEWCLAHTNDYPLIQSLIWMLLGSTHVRLADFSKASICHLHYLAFCRERTDFPGITKAECSLGIAYMKLGLYKLAGRCFLQYLENCQLLQDDKGISVAYNNLGLLSKILATNGYAAAVKEGSEYKAEETLKSNLKRAVVYFEQHLGLEEQFGNVNKQANAFGNLGTCNELLKQYTQAIFCHNKRLEISRSIGDRSTESCALCNLGNCFRAVGKLEEALQYYVLNLELTRSIEHKTGEVVTLLNLGTTYELLNKIDQAIEWYTLYLSMTVQREDVHGEARGLCILASLYQESRQLLKAHEYYKRLVGIFHQLGERNAEASAQKFTELTRKAIEREKEQNETKRKKKKKKKRSLKKSNTVSRMSGLTLSNPALSEQDGRTGRARPPRPQRPRPPLAVDGIATLTAAQRTEFEKLRRQTTNMRSTESLASACVFDNPAYTHLQEEYDQNGGVLPGLSGTPVHNEYYQQWLLNRTNGYQDVQLEMASEARRSMSPVFSDAGWSHNQTLGLSPDLESQVDWCYPYAYPYYTFGGGLNTHVQGLPPQSPRGMTMSPQPFPPSGYVSRSPTTVGERRGYANVMRVEHSDTESEMMSEYASVRGEEEEEEGDDDFVVNRQHHHHHIGEQTSGEDASPQRPRVMRSTSNCSVLGSQRHFEELEKIGRDFTTHQKGDCEGTELSDGIDKEWEQWILMQEEDALTRVVSMRETDVGKYRNKYRRRRHRSFTCRPAVSAPQLGGEPPISEEEVDLSEESSPYSSDHDS